MSQFKINEELIDRIKKLISSGDKAKLIENLKDVHYADIAEIFELLDITEVCLLYTSPSPRDGLLSRMPSSA